MLWQGEALETALVILDRTAMIDLDFDLQRSFLHFRDSISRSEDIRFEPCSFPLSTWNVIHLIIESHLFSFWCDGIEFINEDDCW